MCTSILTDDEALEKKVFDIIYKTEKSFGTKEQVAKEFARESSKRFVKNTKAFNVTSGQSD